MGMDLIPHIDSAEELLAGGRLPFKGCLSSYASYIPPGITWLLVPGVFLFNDPRLFEYIGSAFLYVGTLIGIFLLARTWCGMRCALFSVGLYAFSELGLRFASSLWPRGQPFFYIWMVYWAGRWIIRNDWRYLAAAIVTWAAGMYVFLEIAPALFILPAIWLIYRRSLGIRPLLVGGVLTLAIWYPYLQFEAARDFADLKSQVLRQNLLPVNYKDGWCDSRLTREDTARNAEIFRSKQTVKAPDNSLYRLGSRFVEPIVEKIEHMSQLLPSNFRYVMRVPGASMVLLLLALSGMALLSMRQASFLACYRLCCYWLMPFALGMVTAGVLANELLLARYLSLDGSLEASTIVSIRRFQAVLVLSGMGLLAARRKITAIINRLRVWAEADIQQTTQCAKHVGVLALAFLSHGLFCCC